MEREVAKPLKQKPKLNYRFHNPNTVEVTAEYIAHILVDVNRTKIEKQLREATLTQLRSEKNEDAAE